MRQDLCLVVVLCLLPSPLGADSMPPDGDGQRLMSAVPGSEPKQPTQGSTSSDTDEEGERLQVSLPGKEEQDDLSTGRLLVAVARTLVTSTASTTTVAVFSTCHDAVAAPVAGLPVCTGKKRRRLILFHPEMLIADTGLESSLQNEPVLFDKPIKRKGRFIIWTSSVTTVLFTATSTNAAVIVSARYKCSFPALVICG